MGIHPRNVNYVVRNTESTIREKPFVRRKDYVGQSRLYRKVPKSRGCTSKNSRYRHNPAGYGLREYGRLLTPPPYGGARGVQCQAGCIFLHLSRCSFETTTLPVGKCFAEGKSSIQRQQQQQQQQHDTAGSGDVIIPYAHSDHCVVYLRANRLLAYALSRRYLY